MRAISNAVTASKQAYRVDLSVSRMLLSLMFFRFHSLCCCHTPCSCSVPALFLPCSCSVLCSCPVAALFLLCSCPVPALFLPCSCPVPALFLPCSCPAPYSDEMQCRQCISFSPYAERHPFHRYRHLKHWFRSQGISAGFLFPGKSGKYTALLYRSKAAGHLPERE